MSQTKKISLFIVLGLIVGIMSLGSSLAALRISYSSSEVAKIKEDSFIIELISPTRIYMDEDTGSVIKNPIITSNEIGYGLELKKINSGAQFQFDISNKGDLPGRVVNINIYGIEEYKDYIDINIEGINVGDVVESDKVIKKVNVRTTYFNPLYDESGLIKTIKLEDLKIEIEFESIDKGDLNEEEN